MRTLAFLLRRFAAQRLLGLAIVVAFGFTIGVLVAGPVYAAASREAIATAAVRTATVNVRNVRLSFYGNVLFSTGPNTELGGKNDTPCHMDMPMRGCSLWVDGQQILDGGKVVHKEMRAPGR